MQPIIAKMYLGVGDDMGGAMDDNIPAGGSDVGPKIEEVDQAAVSLLGFLLPFFFSVEVKLAVG